MTSARKNDQPLYLVVAAVFLSGAFLMFYFALQAHKDARVQGASTSQPASVVEVQKPTVEEPGRLSPVQLQEDASGLY